MPSAWMSLAGHPYCLSCSRAQAADAALDAAPGSASREDRMRLRRKALIGFEIERSPDQTDRVIANSCRTSSQTVAVVRAELDRPDGAIETIGAGDGDRGDRV